MNDISIQGGRAYAAAYASNDVKIQSSTPSTAATTISATTSDTVSISAEAKELFQQSSVAEEPITPMQGGNGIRPTVDTPITPMQGGNGMRPPVDTPIAPMQGGNGIRP